MKKEYIKVEDSLPELVNNFDDWAKSKRVVVLVAEHIAEYNKGADEGEVWEQWYCPDYE